jgi:cardiolipin synthase
MHVYQPTMYHCKTIIVDGLLVSVGSTNFDPRSFHLNDEANLNVYDAKFAAQLTRVFENDLRRCKPCTLEQWRSRPLLEKVRERVTSWLAPVL